MMKRAFRIAVGVLVLLALTSAVAWAAPAAQEGEAAVDALWIALAPLVAIATFVERILEAFWERWEKVGLWPNRVGVPDVSSPDYVMKKKLGSHWLGTLLALVAVGLTNLRFFRLLGFDVLCSQGPVLFDAGIGGIFDAFTVGTLIDWVLTAGVIGWGGTELTHSVIEGLVKGRNLWKEMREVKEGQKSILDVKFFNDYVTPQLERHGISVAALRQTFQTLSAAGVSVDTLIGEMTAGKADAFLTQLEERPNTQEAARAVRTLLEGVPPEQRAEIPHLLGLITREQRQRFLGA
jgi:hypothetical protein